MINEEPEYVGAVYCKFVEEETGISVSLGFRRDARTVLGRNAVAYAMATIDGFTEYEIGRALNRNHSSVHHMKQRIQDAIVTPGANRPQLDVWKKLKNRIYEYRKR